MKSYRTKEALRHLQGFRITQNQLIHWAEKRIVVPSIRDASGYSSYREYAFRDLVKAAIVSRLLTIGMSLYDVEDFFELWEEDFRDVQKKGYKTIWDALKAEPDEFQYYCEITYADKTREPPSDWQTVFDFWPDAADCISRPGRVQLKDQILIRSVRIVNISEIVHILKVRTGDSF